MPRLRKRAATTNIWHYLPTRLIATLALLARNDVGIFYDSAIFYLEVRLQSHIVSAIAHHASVPATARNVYVRAARHNIDAALWGIDICKCNAH